MGNVLRPKSKAAAAPAGAAGAACCHGNTSFYSSPKEASRLGPRETLLYVPCVVPDASRPDYLATIDVDPRSEQYLQVIHRTPVGAPGEELHHSGWNSCSSCFGDPSAPGRNLLVLPSLHGGAVHAVDVATDPRAPRLFVSATRDDIQAKTGLAYLHTGHCLADGSIMVSAMGDADGKQAGNFVLLDARTLEVKGTWAKANSEFGYDFWYQPRLNVMVSTAWGAPAAFTKGFDPADLAAGKYGDSIYVWDWTRREVVQTLKLGADGLVPLEVRFLHDPAAPHGFVGAALASNIIYFGKKDAVGNGDGAKLPGEWAAEVAHRQPWADVTGWALPQMPPLITDILISLDDRWLFFSNWLRGDVVLLDIADPRAPRVAARLWLGGVLRADGGLAATGGLPDGLTGHTPEPPRARGQRLRGGPQMLQLSLDGTRLYVTNSLYSAWDKQFYPELAAAGSQLLKVDVDPAAGTLALDTDFLVDFGAEPGGPVLAHEVRYPGGDCSSDIWL